MGTRIKVAFFIIIIIFISLGIYIYFTKDKVVREDLPIKSLLIDAIDHGERVKVNYTILSNRTLVYSGRTRTDSYQNISFPYYKTELIIQPNDDKYYSDKTILVGDKVSIELNRVGKLNVTHSGNLSSGKVSLNITTDESNRELSLCFRWSNNIIDVYNEKYQGFRVLDTRLDCETGGFQWTESETICNWACKFGITKSNITIGTCSSPLLDVLPPKRLVGKVDKCLFVRYTIKYDEPLEIDLYIKKYILNKDDFIRVYVLDNDKDLNQWYKFEDNMGNDVGAKDFIYVVK